MRLLIIDDKAKNRIANMVEHAEKNPFSMDDLLDIHNKELMPPGDLDGFSCNIQVGFRVVYSIEQQTPANVRHLSVSVDKDGKLPSPEAVKEIMELIGFENELENCMIKLENISPMRQAINVLEFINHKQPQL